MYGWLVVLMTTQAFGAQSGSPGIPAVTAPVLSVGSLLAKGDLGLKNLKRNSYVSGQVLSRNREASVYAGFRDPIFQIVLFGKDQENPQRVLIEFDPKKQSFEALAGFNTDWAQHFSASAARPATLETFSGDASTHLKAYCGRLPAGARCEVLLWNVPSGRVLRADIHLKQGPSVPKAIEFERSGSSFENVKSAGNR
jgi:hypothetical protein